MVSDSARRASRVELTSSAIAWPRPLLPLVALVVAVLLGGAPGVPAFLFGWMFSGARLALGARRPRRLVVGAAEEEARPRVCCIDWADVVQIEVSSTRARRRFVRIVLSAAGQGETEIQVRCTVDEGEAICRAAQSAGGVHPTWLGSVRSSRLRSGLRDSAAGAVLYGCVALACGQTPTAAALAALVFGLCASIGCLVSELAAVPSARITGVVQRGVGVFTFARDADLGRGRTK